MLERADIIKLKQDTVSRLSGIDVDAYGIYDTDERLYNYVKSVIDNPEDHNLYELLSILRFFRLLETYIFKGGSIS